MNIAMLALATVKSFRGYAVVKGVVQVSNSELVKHLDDTYAEVTICGLNVKPGGALLQLAPIQFEAIKREFQEELQYGLQGQLAACNDVDIDWHD